MSDSIFLVPGGTVQLASVASAGEINLDPQSFSVDHFESLGNLDLAYKGELSGLFVPGFGFVASIDVSSDNGGGVILIRGGNFVVDTARVFADSGAGEGGVADLEIRNELRLVNGAKITADSFGTAAGGTVSVKAGSLVLVDGGLLQVDRYDDGPGGHLSVEVDDSVTIAGRSDESIPLVGDQASGLFAGNFRQW